MPLSPIQAEYAVLDSLTVHAQEFGLDCMHFNPHVYHDLLRCGDGSAEGLVTAFFDVVRIVSAPVLPEISALSTEACAHGPLLTSN